MAQQIKKKFLAPEVISYFDNQIDAVENSLSTETLARENADSALSGRLSPIESLLDFEKLFVYETNTQVIADGQAPVEDSSLRAGWYYQNLSAGQKINWYFFDGINQANIQKQNFSAYAVMTFDSVASLPIIAFYTVPTGTNDVMPGFAHSRYIFSNFASTPVVGKKYLIYIGEEPTIHPELPRIKVNLTSSQGEQLPTERVLTVSFGSNSSASVGNVKFMVEHLGVFSPSYKANVELKIRAASLKKLEDEIVARGQGDNAAIEYANMYTDTVAGQLSELINNTAENALLVDGTRGMEGNLIMGDVAGPMYKIVALADGVDAHDAVNKGQLDSAISQEVSNREAADLILDNKIDVEKARIDAILIAADADKDSFAEIVQLINSVDTENDSAFAGYVLSNNARVDALEAKGFSKGSQVVGTELAYIDLDRVYSTVLSVSVGRLAAHEGEDYSVSVVGGKTRLTWINSFANPSGDEKIETGDKVFWSGAY